MLFEHQWSSNLRIKIKIIFQVRRCFVLLLIYRYTGFQKEQNITPAPHLSHKSIAQVPPKHCYGLLPQKKVVLEKYLDNSLAISLMSIGEHASGPSPEPLHPRPLPRKLIFSHSLPQLGLRHPLMLPTHSKHFLGSLVPRPLLLAMSSNLVINHLMTSSCFPVQFFAASLGFHGEFDLLWGRLWLLGCRRFLR